MSAVAERTALDAFRTEAHAWIAQNFPPSLKGVSFMAGGEPSEADGGDAKRWKEALCTKGWGTPTWPREFGGGGLSPGEARVLNEEMRKAGAGNPLGFGMGVRMLGPTLLEYGTEAQKKQHIPPIVRGETRWCQGYSEPGAGSDLASLRTQCVDKGDHYLVNGQKIWTSGAQFADWCFCLVRTDNSKKHEGISFLLIDMKSPGVRVQPIRLISGNSPFCETFFTDVKVPKENLVGQLNRGWTIGKRLLQFERQGADGGAPTRGGDSRPLGEIAKHYVGVDEKGRVADAELRLRIAEYNMNMHAFALTVARKQAEAKGNRGPDVTTSVMKNARSRFGQDREELVIEIMGNQGLGWDGDAFTKNEREAVRSWLSGKATTIFAGSYEIQNNIIAKRILGLLDHQ
jgi:alkylation response protein AidB-like acyl-CoA dehydrogenase